MENIMNSMRHWINLIESTNLDNIIPGELPGYNTLANQLKAVQKNGSAIQLISNPSEEVRLAAVKKDGNAIFFIKNPSEEVRLAAVKKDGQSIKYISKPSEQVQLEAVQNNGGAIYYMMKKRIVPSIAVQRAAVLQSPVIALASMIGYDFPISKMIQWIAAKRIKELKKVKKIVIPSVVRNGLAPDVQKYLKSKKP